MLGGSVKTTSFVAESAVTLIEPVVAGVRPVLVTARTYVPRAFRVKFEKLAVPPLAVAVSVPPRALLSDGLSIDTVTLPWKSGSAFPD